MSITSITSTSKKTIQESFFVLETLKRKCEYFYSEGEPQSEYVFEFYASIDFPGPASEGTALLGVATYSDNRYAVFAPEALPIDYRKHLFDAFVDQLWARVDNQIIVFTQQDYDAVIEARKGKGIRVDVKLLK